LRAFEQVYGGGYSGGARAEMGWCLMLEADVWDVGDAGLRCYEVVVGEISAMGV
jgi:hypothetical protein